jgi:hypothetical protein
MPLCSYSEGSFKFCLHLVIYDSCCVIVSVLLSPLGLIQINKSKFLVHMHFINRYMCVSFGNGCLLVFIISILVFTVFFYCLCSVCGIVSFMYMCSYLFCLDCHRATTQLQLVIMMIVIIIT